MCNLPPRLQLPARGYLTNEYVEISILVTIPSNPHVPRGTGGDGGNPVVARTRADLHLRHPRVSVPRLHQDFGFMITKPLPHQMQLSAGIARHGMVQVRALISG